MLQRLKPSLEPYIGCTIIDINPGVGLFSRKLHEYLRPRNHVLFEPKQRLYLQFLKPLLDNPGSRYCLKDWPDEYRWEASNFIREGLMPNAEGVGGSPPTTEPPNNLALIIGNVANWKWTSPGQNQSKKSMKAVNYPVIKALDYARRVRQIALSSSAPPPRMLMWMSDMDKHSILPKTIHARNKTSSILEAYCHVEEIAGAKSRPTVRREDTLNERSMARVAKTMRKSGIQVPERDSTGLDDVKRGLANTSRDWHQELLDLEEAFKAEKIPQFVGLPAGPLQRRKFNRNDPTRTPEWEKLMELRQVLNGQNKDVALVSKLLRKQAEIDRMDVQIARSKSTDKDQPQSRFKTLDIRIAELKELQAKLSKKQLNQFMFMDDERRAFEMEPPLLMWDRRNAEPLVAQDTDFYHPQDLALLDFQIDPDSNVPSTTSDQNTYYDTLATNLLVHRGPTTLRRLNSVGPGAYEALVRNLPSIQNPLKGGRRDVDSIRVRTMTPELLREVAVAWDEWPFKPPMSEILAQSDPDTIEFMRGGGPGARD